MMLVDRISAIGSVAGAAVVAAVALTVPSVAGAEDATNDRAALQRALASVNEGGRDYEPIPGTQGRGFFGRGFQVYSDQVGADFGGDRVGGRPDERSVRGDVAREARESRGETILLRR